MNIGDEVQLRSRLRAELDLLDPGPLPLDAVVKQGRAVMIRRRVLAAAAVVIVAAAAVTLPKLVHIVSQPPASPLRYHVTVNPPGQGASKHLIAYGTLNKLRWISTGTVSDGTYRTCWKLPSQHNDAWCDGTGPPAPAFPTAPATFHATDGTGPVWVTLDVRADIRHLLVSLSNGQTITLRPVQVFGRHFAGLVAIAVPSNKSITEIQAYSATGEVGYTVPFAAPSDVEIVRWLKPGQAAVPKPASHTLAFGRIRGYPWAERLYVGPWGVCFTSNWKADAGVSYLCVPISVNQPGRSARSAGTQYFNGQAAFSLIVGPRQLDYVVAHPGHGAPFLVRPYRVGATSFVVLAAQGNSTTGWIAYSATGQRLGSSSF